MATKFKITVRDTVTTVAVKPKHILQSEREQKQNDLDPVEATYRLAWMASGSDLGFEEWLDTVDDIDPILPPDAEDGEADEVPPTTAGSRRSRPSRA
jgi:hypothetical protein